MPDPIALTGVVATDPRHVTTNSGLDIVHFRLASGQRRYDREKNDWVDGETNWYTVTAFRRLATHVAGSIERGQHVVVTGRLRVRSWENGEKSGTTVDVEADAVGHDLTWGTSLFRKATPTTPTGAQGVAQQEFAASGELHPASPTESPQAPEPSALGSTPSAEPVLLPF